MAIVPYLLTRKANSGKPMIDGIQAMILAIDSAVQTTDTLIFNKAAEKLRALGHPVPDSVADVPSSLPYFDTKVALSTYDAAGDNTVFLQRNSVTTIA